MKGRKYKIEGRWVRLTFPYDKDLVEEIKSTFSYKYRVYDAQRKEWGVIKDITTKGPLSNFLKRNEFEQETNIEPYRAKQIEHPSRR